GAPEILRLAEQDLFLRRAPFEPAFAVADAEVAEPGLADLDVPVRELGVDADLVDDRVVAEAQLERRVVLEPRARVLDAEHARDLLLRLVLHPVERGKPVDRLAAQRADEPL